MNHVSTIYSKPITMYVIKALLVSPNTYMYILRVH